MHPVSRCVPSAGFHLPKRFVSRVTGSKRPGHAARRSLRHETDFAQRGTVCSRRVAAPGRHADRSAHVARSPPHRKAALTNGNNLTPTVARIVAVMRLVIQTFQMETACSDPVSQLRCSPRSLASADAPRRPRRSAPLRAQPLVRRWAAERSARSAVRWWDTALAALTTNGTDSESFGSDRHEAVTFAEDHAFELACHTRPLR
jgi:hypothetical protein